MVHPDILLFGISGGEILILLLIVLLLFGPGKIPEMARMIGRGMREVKKVQREINTEIHRYSSDIEKEAREMRSNLENRPDSVKKPGEADSKKDYKGSQPDTGNELATKDKPKDEGRSDESNGNEQEVSKSGTSAGQEEDDLPYPYGKNKDDSGSKHP